VSHFKGLAYTVAYARLNDPFLAEDAVQEAFVEAFSHLGSLKDEDAFPGWFKVIVERQCYRMLRGKKHAVMPIEETASLIADPDGVDSIIERREWEEKLLRSVEGLPPALRIAVQLFYYRGYSIKEISSFLGVSASTMKKRLFDARKKLRTSLLVSDFASVLNDLYQGGEKMLHIVNGDHVGNKLREGNVQGDILVWREVYPVGPAFASMAGNNERLLRAAYLEKTLGILAPEYIKSCESQETRLQNFSKYDEVVMWFEHDLFDQTMLAFLLHWFSKQSLGNTKLNLLCIGDYPGIDLFRGMGQLTTEQLKTLSGTWRPIGEEELTLGAEIWEAYASRDVEKHVGILRSDPSVLPFVPSAFTMHLNRLPSPGNGLGIVEQTTLELVKNGVQKPAELFTNVGDRLHELGMGDLEFRYRLKTMAELPKPLLKAEGTDYFLGGPSSAKDGTVALTRLGQEVLAGEKDWLLEKEVDEWYGGLPVTNEMEWRWDRSGKRLVYIGK